MKRTINSCKEGCQILHLQTINPFCNLNMSEKRLGKNLIKREVEFVRTLLLQVFFLSLNDPLVVPVRVVTSLKLIKVDWYQIS